MTLLRTIVTMTQRSSFCLNGAVRLVTDLALLATLLNLLAIAVNHYLSILKPLMCKMALTKIWDMFAVLVIWFASLLAIAVEIIMGIVHQREKESLCVVIAYDTTNAEYGIVTSIFVVLLVIFLIYGRIYIWIVRNRSIYSKTSHWQKDTSNNKALVSTSLFVLTFVLFWMPIGIFNIYIYNKDVTYILNNFDKIEQAGDILYVIMLLNAIADPIIYTRFCLPLIYRKSFIFRTRMRREPTKKLVLTSEE
jgi:hypothetical protein